MAFQGEAISQRGLVQLSEVTGSYVPQRGRSAFRGQLPFFQERGVCATFTGQTKAKPRSAVIGRDASRLRAVGRWKRELAP